MMNGGKKNQPNVDLKCRLFEDCGNHVHVTLLFLTVVVVVTVVSQKGRGTAHLLKRQSPLKI